MGVLIDLVDSPNFIPSGKRKTHDRRTGKQSGESSSELTLNSERGVSRGIVSWKQGTVRCAQHGAMNSMGGGVWRCLAVGCGAAAYLKRKPIFFYVAKLYHHLTS